MNVSHNSAAVIDWFRQASPYIQAHRGRTVVLAVGGEALEDAGFAKLMADVVLLVSLGLRVVLVHGARPQIEQALAAAGHESRLVDGIRVTDDVCLDAVKASVGQARLCIEAQLSASQAHAQVGAQGLRVASGNFVVAKPIGVRDGVDLEHTCEVRRIDVPAIVSLLDSGALVLLSNLGFSPTGEIFNLNAEDLAAEVAVALRADKLLSLVEGEGLLGDAGLQRSLSPGEAQQLLGQMSIADGLAHHARAAIRACRRGVKRAHLIERRRDGALLLELFTRDGIGTLITEERYETARRAQIDDVGGILALIRPLEESGVLVRRSREQIELEIDQFEVLERDGSIIGCAALHRFAERRTDAELACLVVHPDYRGGGRGDLLLQRSQGLALESGIKRLFVLSTQTMHWFVERGFVQCALDALPAERLTRLQRDRNAKLFVKNFVPD